MDLDDATNQDTSPGPTWLNWLYGRMADLPQEYPPWTISNSLFKPLRVRVGERMSSLGIQADLCEILKLNLPSAYVVELGTSPRDGTASHIFILKPGSH